MTRLYQFYHNSKKHSKKLLLLISIIVISLGIYATLHKRWLLNVADSYAKDGTCCPCRKYFFYISILPVIVGGFLFLLLIGKTQIIKIYEQYQSKPKTLAGIFLVTIFIILVGISYITFHNFPYSVDEYSYLYQAKILSKNKLFIEVSEVFRPFKETYMVLKDGKLFSQYPPGFPLILAIGVVLNVPGLINPLIAILTSLVMYCFVQSILNKKYALLASLLMSTTPYFLAYSASYYSHSTALLMTVLIFFILRKYETSSHTIFLCLYGLVSGYSFITRPVDSFCVIVPTFVYLVYILYKNRQLAKVGYFVLMFGLVFSAFIIHNYLLTNTISVAVYPVVKGAFRIVDEHAQGFVENLYSISIDYLKNGGRIIPLFLGKYLLIQVGLLIPFLAIFGFFNFKSIWKWILLSNFALLILTYNFHYGFAWPQYGTRYYYSGYGSLVVLSTVGTKKIIEFFKNEKFTFGFLSFIACVHLICNIVLFNQYAFRFDMKLKMIDDIVRICPEKSIVILDRTNARLRLKETVESSDISECLRYDRGNRWIVDFGSEKRNMFMNGPRFFTFSDEKNLEMDTILEEFPGYSRCYYEYDNFPELISYE